MGWTFIVDTKWLLLYMKKASSCCGGRKWLLFQLLDRLTIESIKVANVFLEHLHHYNMTSGELLTWEVSHHERVLVTSWPATSRDTDKVIWLVLLFNLVARKLLAMMHYDGCFWENLSKLIFIFFLFSWKHNVLMKMAQDYDHLHVRLELSSSLREVKIII